MNDHTPTPWYVDGNDHIYATEGERIQDRAITGPWAERNYANVAFIVRAVNAHEALVEALADTLRALESHLDESTRDHNLGHRDLLCPCSTNEVVKAYAALALAETK